MIRVYLDTFYIEDKKTKSSISIESEKLNLNAVSYHYDTNSNNILAIVEGQDAEKLTAFMMPPNDLNKSISELPPEDITNVINELNNRGIVTEGSITCGDLINNICNFFNANFNSLGEIMSKDFS